MNCDLNIEKLITTLGSYLVSRSIEGSLNQNDIVLSLDIVHQRIVSIKSADISCHMCLWKHFLSVLSLSLRLNVWCVIRLEDKQSVIHKHHLVILSSSESIVYIRNSLQDAKLYSWASNTYTVKFSNKCL